MLVQTTLQSSFSVPERVIDLTAETTPCPTKETIAILQSKVANSWKRKLEALNDSKPSEAEQQVVTETKAAVAKKVKIAKSKKTKIPPHGYCVAGIDIGLKNFSICLMRQNLAEGQDVPDRPTILEWRNTNLYADRTNGKIIQYEAADKLLERVTNHLDDVGKSTNDWKDVHEVAIESQSASTSAIRRVETIVFSYFYYRHPHIKVKTISASKKLSLPGMDHSKEESGTYKGRKNLAVQYARRFMEDAPDKCPFKHRLDPLPRKRKGEGHSGSFKADDLADSALVPLYLLGISIPS